MKTNTANQAATTEKNNRKATNAQIDALQAKREELKKLSEPLKKLVEKSKIQTINEGLKQKYAKQGHTNLKTLKAWNKEGYNVNKGEHALLLWGKRKESTPKDESSEKYMFSPICFVFSQKQVTPKEPKVDVNSSN